MPVSFYGVIQAAARALLVTIIPPPRDSSPLASPFGGGGLLSPTPEGPRTPRATTSFSSILSEPGAEHDASGSVLLKTPGPSVSRSVSAGTSMVTGTPSYNSCMTVPVTFTPKAPRGNGGGSGGGSARKTRGEKRKGVGMGVLEEEGEDEGEELADPLSTGSPKRRKKAA